MSNWQALDDELGRWRDAGRIAELWWRDDDAADAGPELDRLLVARGESAMPLALAVVPARATTALAARLADEPAVDLLQHGYAHVNHAAPGEAKKIELGPHRPVMMVLGELGTGWMALERLFGARPLSVMVPPWNRIAPALVPTLPEIGFTGLSTFGARRRAQPVRGLRQVNTHADLIDWKGGRGFAGEEAVLSSLVRALAHARAESGEPVGLLSHHLAMDGGAWDFLKSFWERTRTMSGLRVRSAHELFVAGLPEGEETRV
ncbi:polysaccharide deacetylase family protein [Reyranella sp.]|uniref:polysaccharide deacetylase family protein n=1 Tax=Reyranella sp. TaxID=1929291 RepID=UPI0027317657|nr:polysaccharide deacetylase family protein [Reyranella sp.]MDP2376875.1 polysaccharide deacetylase family protein [Reyranella sp.]